MGPTLTSLTTSAEREQDQWTAARRDVRGDRVLLVVAAGLGLWVVAFALAVDLTTTSPAHAAVVQGQVDVLLVVASLVLTAVMALRSTGHDRVFWAATATAVSLWLAGVLVGAAAVAGVRLPGWTGPLLAVLAVAIYLPGGVCAVFIGGRPQILQVGRGLFDMGVVSLAACYLGYEYAVAPARLRGGSALAVATAASPVFDTMLIVVAITAGIATRQLIPASRLMINFSVVVLLALGVLSSPLVRLHGSVLPWLGVGAQCEAALICLAAVTALRHREIEGRPRALPSRLPMVAVVTACVAALLVVGAHVLDHRATTRDVVIGGVVFGVLVVRGVIGNREFRRIAVRLEQARSEQERLAVTDALTGLYNRRFFEEFLRLEADRSQRHGSPVSLLVADLDHFKRVNDEHGHLVGDDVLVEASRRLRTAVRASDVLARYGGEEFVVVLPDTGSEAALEIAERCRRVLVDAPVVLERARSRSEPEGVRVTASFGLATLWAMDDSTVDDLVRAADRALYRAKSAGRNRVAPAGAWDFLDLGVDGERAQPLDRDPVAVALLRAAELVDADQATDEHGTAIARWCAVIVDDLGLGSTVRRRCILAARLHDVGKLAIPRSVLTKPSALDDQEWTLMRTHPEHSEALVGLASSLAGLGPLVRAHHERFDGAGYPDRLAGAAIPVEARVVAVCDSWAAMRADRVYAAARPVAECRDEIARGRGHQFDPDVADAFLRLQGAGLVGDLGTVAAAVVRSATDVEIASLPPLPACA